MLPQISQIKFLLTVFGKNLRKKLSVSQKGICENLSLRMKVIIKFAKSAATPTINSNTRNL